jgi:GNAT superfamily N-acetyltransferase
MVPVIRRGTLEDAPVLIDLRLAFYQELETIQNEETWQHYKQAVRRYFLEKLATGELHTWVADAAGEIVATGALLLEPKPPTQKNMTGLEAFVFNMYTLPAWRGKGLASRILDEMIGFAKEHEAGRVWLYASEQGEPVYARAGFVIKQRKRPEMELYW